MIVGCRGWRPHRAVTVCSLWLVALTVCPCPWLHLRTALSQTFLTVSLPPRESTSSEKHVPSNTSQDSRACTFPCIPRVLLDGFPGAVHYQLKVWMKWIHSSSPWEPQGWSSCWGSLQNSSLELPKSQPKQCCHCFSSYPFIPAYTHTE